MSPLKALRWTSLFLILSLAAPWSEANVDCSHWKVILDRLEEPTPMEFIEADRRCPFSTFFKTIQQEVFHHNSAQWTAMRSDHLNQLFQLLDKRLGQELPYFLSLLETHFPNAIWAPMGRDGGPLARALGFFYAVVGEPERVVRIPTSNPSVEDASMKQLRAVLVTHGLSMQRKFILFDRSSMHASQEKISQTTKLVRAGYRHLLASGMKREDILHHFGIVGVGESPVDQFKQIPLDAFESYIHQQMEWFKNVDEEYVAKLSQLGYEGTPNTMPFLPFSSVRDGVFSDGVTWHTGYGRIIEQPDDKTQSVRYVGEINGLDSIESRLAILSAMSKIYSIVARQDFVDRVNRQLKQADVELRFEFREEMAPSGAASLEVGLEERIEEIFVRLKNELNNLAMQGARVDDLSDYLSQSGQSMKVIVTRSFRSLNELGGIKPDVTNRFVYQFLKSLDQVLRQMLISSVEYRRLAAFAIEKLDLRDGNIRYSFGKYLMTSRPLNDLLVTKPWAFSEEFSPGVKNIAEVERRYNWLKKNVPVLVQNCQQKLASTQSVEVAPAVWPPELLDNVQGSAFEKHSRWKGPR